MSDSEVAFPTPLALPLIHRFFGISRSGLSARIRFKYCGDNGLQLDFHVVMDLRVTTSSNTRSTTWMFRFVLHLVLVYPETLM
jgi:hypothetical protein